MRFAPEGPAPDVRCPGTPTAITCASCGRRWAVASAFSANERQAVESCPCPGCGAYTLCCGDGPEDQAAPPPAVRGEVLPSRGL